MDFQEIQLLVLLDDCGKLRARFTVEERADGQFISTFWDPTEGFEPDRQVREFETLSAALAHMYQRALIFSLEHSTLTVATEDKV